MISFGIDLKDYAFAMRKEFLLTAGRAYCSSSLAGNTRKYHGLLVNEGHVYLSCLDETVNGKRISVARYKGGLSAEGLKRLTAFSLYPASFYYFVDGCIIKKTIEFDGSLSVRYDVTGECELSVTPLIADRGYHETAKEFPTGHKQVDGGFCAGSLVMTSSLGFHDGPHVYHDVFYQRDHERGFDCIEDLYAPGAFLGVVKNESVTVEAGIAGVIPTTMPSPSPKTPLECLEAAADGVIVDNTILAGFHWFDEGWGRDAFISLPGLLLERRRFDDAKRVFRHFGKRMKGGIIPNRLPDKYNTSDASLWFIYALKKYFEKRDDSEFLIEARRYVRDIMEGYPYSDVASLDRGLITVKPCTTWMDTQHTPRNGKPVEVNALWIEALRFAGAIGVETPVEADTALKAFEAFWNPEKGCLYDVIDPADDRIRPNQVVAIASGLVEANKALSALGVMAEALLTPYGLRTLAPFDPSYQGRFNGDRSYHNGCVWPWLTGLYVESLLKAGMPAKRISPLLAPLMGHVSDAGLGSVSEIFDGDAPHEPNGCISQAWSVAETLRSCKMLKEK